LDVTQEDVSRSDELLRERSSFSCSKIHDDTFLAAIPDMKPWRSSGFVAGWWFDLDHLGSLFGEKHTGVRSGDSLCDLDNPYAI
jgi:hypothetical protein